MLVNSVTEGAVYEADICIVGAGPAGLTLAQQLEDVGAKVVLLESGDLVPDPAVQLLAEGSAWGPVLRDYTSYLRDSRHFQFGGAGAWWGGYCVPFSPLDFAVRRWVPDSGWPFGAETVAPYYDRAATFLGFEPFNGQSDSKRLRRPLVPQKLGPMVNAIYHIPRTLKRFTADAERQMRANPQVTVLLRSVARTLSGEGDRIECLEATHGRGVKFSVRSPIFVLAAGGMENARLLLEASEFPGAGQRINRDLVGRFFMEHFHVKVGSVAIERRDEWSIYLRNSVDEGLGHRTFGVFTPSEETQRQHHLLNYSVQIKETGDPTDDPGHLKGYLFARAEQAPNPRSRLVLGDSLDRLGRRRLALRWEVAPEDWRSIIRSTNIVSSALREIFGARIEVSVSDEASWPDEPRGPYGSGPHSWGCHHMGTTRMHVDPARGVVDPDCRVHGIANLFVAGSSVFPTSSFANPTFTLIALAIRLADHLRRPPFLDRDGGAGGEGSGHPPC